MNPMLVGPLLAAAVAVLKRVPFVGAFVARNPKTAAAVGAAVVSYVQSRGFDVTAWTLAPPAGWDAAVAQTVGAFAGAVATHEMVLDPVAKLVRVPAARGK